MLSSTNSQTFYKRGHFKLLMVSVPSIFSVKFHRKARQHALFHPDTHKHHGARGRAGRAEMPYREPRTENGKRGRLHIV